MTPIAAANTLQVSDTRLASCYRALGFRYVCKPVIHERTSKLSTQFLFEVQSLRFPQLDLRNLNAAWKSGELQQKEPLHLLCVMMCAQHNYDCLLAWVKEGVTHTLRSIPCGSLTVYEPGPLPVDMIGAEETDDMRLAASVGILGSPVMDIASSGAGRHVFRLARYGYAVRLSTGELHLHDARRLLQRAPIKEDPLRLRMEEEQPLHPLCIAYDGLYNRTELKRELSRPHLLLIDEPGKVLAGSGERETVAARQAMIDINAPGHVMDQVTAHMKAPPLHWS